jgi:hypothetical protein
MVAMAAGLAGAGCFKGDFANCRVTCATNADCPGGLACNAQGVCSPGGGACSAMPDADLTKPQSLTVTKTGDGDVQSDPAGINCGTTCMAEFAPLASVTLTATPAAASVFEGWSGDCSGTTSTCSLTMDGPKTAEAQFALHGAKRWVKQIGTAGQDSIDELEVDANGDVIAAGFVDGLAGVYVIKYGKASGATVWEKTFSAPSYGFSVGGLDTDAAGNVYVCARMQGNGTAITIGNSSVTGDLFGNVLVMRLAAATGEVEWAKSWGGGAQEDCGGLAVSGTDLFVAGYTSSNPATFDGVSFAAATNNGFLVRASTATGGVAAGKHLNGTFDIFDVAENAGQIAVAGEFFGVNYNLDSCNMSTTATGDDGMIMTFSSNLVCGWAKNFGSITNGQTTTTFAVAGVPGGGWVVTGSYQGSVLFAASGSSLPNQGGYDAFIARYAANGTHVWSFGYGSAGAETGRGVAVLPTGETVFTGEFSNTVTFGSFPLTTTNNDVFITRLSPGATPIHEWASKIGGTAYENVQGMGIDSQGTISIVANWTGMTDVAGTQLTAQDYDAWVGQFVR